ncbi:MAG: biotin--[acetyl-CoA-carboxylase] ligase [Sphingobium sp.]|nr:biotin--[acetyl-CoA-carboxylase] ligase [Sphingobium sp.]
MSCITLIAETGSTNADLVELAGRGWDEGHWLRAERQTAGRGRLGRDWQDGAGNLQASTLIRLRTSDPPVSGLGLLIGVALHEALAKLAPDAGLMLKWPNDLVVGSAKLAGILLERVGDAVIVGVGVNIASAPQIEDRETIALSDLPGGQGIDAVLVAEALAASFDDWLARWRSEGFASVRTAWLAAAHPYGTRLSAQIGTDSRLKGRFEGVAEDGALLLGLDDGSTQIVHSGDVGFL